MIGAAAVDEKPLILVTNDDGVGAPGLRALAETLAQLGKVVVAAPDRERSAVSHSISLDRPLRVDEVGAGVYAIDGTPADCVYLAVLHLLPRPPDLCVSGINDGYNLGSDVFYSGTVAGALEAVLRGVPGIAVSLERHRPLDLAPAAAFTGAMAREVLARGGMGAGSLLNVNLPAGRLAGYALTRLGERVYRDQVVAREDLRGRAYYWIGGPEEGGPHPEGSDLNAVRAGLASVTPLGLDLTNSRLLGEMASWRLGDFVQSTEVRVKKSE